MYVNCDITVAQSVKYYFPSISGYLLLHNKPPENLVALHIILLYLTTLWMSTLNLRQGFAGWFFCFTWFQLKSVVFSRWMVWSGLVWGHFRSGLVTRLVTWGWLTSGSLARTVGWALSLLHCGHFMRLLDPPSSMAAGLQEAQGKRVGLLKPQSSTPYTFFLTTWIYGFISQHELCILIFRSGSLIVYVRFLLDLQEIFYSQTALGGTYDSTFSR